MLTLSETSTVSTSRSVDVAVSSFFSNSFLTNGRGDDIKFEDLLVFDHTLNTLTSKECKISLEKFHMKRLPSCLGKPFWKSEASCLVPSPMRLKSLQFAPEWVSEWVTLPVQKSHPNNSWMLRNPRVKNGDLCLLSLSTTHQYFNVCITPLLIHLFYCLLFCTLSENTYANLFSFFL